MNRYGDEPLKFIRRVARKLAPLEAKPLSAKAMDWDALSQDTDQAAKRCKGSKRGMGLAVRAAKRLAYDVRSGNSYTTLDEELTTRYMASVLDADFVDRTASLQPANGISPVVVRERLMELREGIVEELKYFAKQAMRKGTFQSLRLRRRKAIKPVDLDEDLHAIG